MAVSDRRDPAHWREFLRLHPDPSVRETLELIEAERAAWSSRDKLGKLVDLSGIPDSALSGIEFAPSLYLPPDNLGSPQFEFQRTPNLFPTGRIVFGAAGLTPIEQATAFGGIAGIGSAAGPFDVVATGAREWKLLGGIISASAACSVLVVNHRATRCYAGLVFAAAGSQTFTIPGNGGRALITGPKRSFQIVSSAIANIDFVLWVAEELDPT
jgi:hypothetical protein